MSTLATREDQLAIWTFPSGIVANFDLDGGRALLEAAREAKARAYAPYSKFQVGAAVLMDGTLFTGTNVEIASYGGTICAERTAIGTAISAGHRRIDRIAVSTSASPGTPLEDRSPCGICRQVISEFASDETLVLIDGGNAADGRLLGYAVPFGVLLPWRFRFEMN